MNFPKKIKPKFLIYFIILATLLSSLFLFLAEKKLAEPSFQKKWTVAYFANLNKDDFSFYLENFEGEALDYRYQMIDEKKNIIYQELITLKNEEKRLIVPNPAIAGQLRAKKPITIIIDYPGQQKTLKKN